jgi:hypothetical protein
MIRVASPENCVAALLIRNIDLEEDLCDQPFNHSEKRLARVLLETRSVVRARCTAHAKIPVFSHEILAEMWALPDLASRTS